MKVLYPSAHQISQLTHAQIALKIARHYPCSACQSCSGLHPPEDVDVVLDDSSPEAPTLEDGSACIYLDTCACGHHAIEHGAHASDIGFVEFARRGRVGVRIDELLQDHGKLLDFNYVDEDISSLRAQMHLSAVADSPSAILPDPPSPVTKPISPASSDLSDLPPPLKRPRLSSVSSLSNADDDDDDEEEDQPLATRRAQTAAPRLVPGGARVPASGQRSGKKLPSMKSKAQTAPTSTPPQTSARAEMISNGFTHREHKVRSEDRMNEGQLARLATGVTLDAGGPPSAIAPVRTEKAATIELRQGIIRIIPVENDGEPRSLVILTGLKTLFQKQLPKMPREYIARLVYDANSRCLAIIKRGYKVVGGICFRPFPHRTFAEIVFFATASVDQEKGYGGMLMDHFKQHIKSTYPGMMHFLTYADNYAVGYFRKQGFSKEITLDRSVWAGYIKDYEGGTIMQCTMLRKVDYLNKASVIAQQREAILSKIKEKSKSHTVYPGLPQFQDPAAGDVAVDPEQVPGLKETGWQLTMATTAVRSTRGAEHQFMKRLLSDLQSHPRSWAFTQPVNKEDVPDYYDVIKQPMDFSLMEHKLETNQYPNLAAFIADAQLVFDNCRKYNPEGSIYPKNAAKLERFVSDEVARYRQKEE